MYYSKVPFEIGTPFSWYDARMQHKKITYKQIGSSRGEAGIICKRKTFYLCDKRIACMAFLKSVVAWLRTYIHLLYSVQEFLYQSYSMGNLHISKLYGLINWLRFKKVLRHMYVFICWAITAIAFKNAYFKWLLKKPYFLLTAYCTLEKHYSV